MLNARINNGLFVLLLLLLTSCKDDKQSQFAMPAPKVSVQEIKLQDLDLEYEYPGRIAGVKVAEVQARVGGIILEKNYIEGGEVKEGEVLFKIDPTPFQALLNEAEANFASQKVQCNLDKLNFERANALLKKNVITKKDYDTAHATYKQSKAMLEKSEAAVKTAKINLGYTTIKAPISGVTSKEVYSVGNLVGTNANNSILTTITQLDPIYIDFAYPEADVMEQKNLLMDNKKTIVNDLKAALKFDDGSEYEKEGIINFTNNTIEPNTGSISARAIFENSNLKLIPGQFIRITVKGIRLKDAIIVPEKSVIQSAKGPIIYVVGDDNIAEVKPVVLGRSTSQGRVIKSGLSKGAKVITSGMIKVQPGHKVQIINSTRPEKSQNETKNCDK